ncbi:hypothetical protein EDC04DRAFT_2892157 [Pisolithus marmoratus]|nr:hypothetical protein EDC04DRAFT_2892157 [Pisolithus marmoratus]
MASPLKLSYIDLQNAKDIRSVFLKVNGVDYPITRSQEKSDTFSRDFHQPLALTTEFSLCVNRRKQRFRRADAETVTIHSDEVLRKLNGQEFLHEWNKVSIKLRFLPQTQPDLSTPSAGVPGPANLKASQPTAKQSVAIHSTSAQDATPSARSTAPVNIRAPANALASPDTPTPTDDEGLRPTTKDLIEQCPRFRVLVVGKSGVGKSTLINRIFGVATAHVAKDRPGEADIEQEFTSPQNDRLILHDSKGFEPGDGGNYETVKSFIEKRKKMPDVKDQLHAVWFCFQIPIPTHGERLLEDAAEEFLKIGQKVLENTPTIIVFTKYDRLMSFMRQRIPGDPGAAQRYLQEDCLQPIQDFMGRKDIAHVAVSIQTLPAKPRYEQHLKDLISLTQEQVSKSFASSQNEVSAVPLAAAGAQRMLPRLKVDLSIEVGKQKYWRLLWTSTNFRGFKMKDCLRVIHTDIVLVWNFYDPCEYLNHEVFRNMMMYMVERVNAAVEPNAPLPRSDTLSGGPPLIGLAPVILPFNACVTLGKWVYETYQRLQDAPTRFMAYIVDLTHVLEILFALTAGIRAKPLTRTAIKHAYKVYFESEWMTHTHTDIRYFRRPTTARDEVLYKITCMIPSSDREDRVARALERIPPIDLEKDEEWGIQEVSR